MRSGWVRRTSPCGLVLILALGDFATLVFDVLVFDVLLMGFTVSAAILVFLASVITGISRTTSCGGLSSRTPLNAAWRTRRSAVQPRKWDSITVFGATQRTSRRRASAWGIRSKGGLSTSSGLSRFHKS